jgi:hypothetical protein
MQRAGRRTKRHTHCAESSLYDNADTDAQAILEILAAHEGGAGHHEDAMDVDQDAGGLDLDTLETDRAKIGRGGTTEAFGAVGKALKKKKTK